MKRLLIGIAVVSQLILVPLAKAQTQAGESKASGEIAQQLIGTWRLLSVETLRPNGQVAYDWMGRNPVGLLIYDPTGHMSLQIMRDPPPTFGTRDLSAATPEEINAAYRGYYAYFGTYEVKEKEGTMASSVRTIIHHVVASLRPDEVGSTLTRQLELSGDRLILTTPMNRLTWERVK